MYKLNINKNKKIKNNEINVKNILLTCTIGKTNDKVFPLPVGADTHMSCGLNGCGC